MGPQSPLSRHDGTKQTLQHALAFYVVKGCIGLRFTNPRLHCTLPEKGRKGPPASLSGLWLARSPGVKQTRKLRVSPGGQVVDSHLSQGKALATNGHLGRFAKSGGASQPARWGEVKLKPRFDAEKATHKVLNNQLTDLHKDVWAF